jgi:hypothetical protein
VTSTAGVCREGAGHPTAVFKKGLVDCLLDLAGVFWVTDAAGWQHQDFQTQACLQYLQPTASLKLPQAFQKHLELRTNDHEQ